MSFNSTPIRYGSNLRQLFYFLSIIIVGYKILKHISLNQNDFKVHEFRNIVYVYPV